MHRLHKHTNLVSASVLHAAHAVRLDSQVVWQHSPLAIELMTHLRPAKPLYADLAAPLEAHVCACAVHRDERSVLAGGARPAELALEAACQLQVELLRAQSRERAGHMGSAMLCRQFLLLSMDNSCAGRGGLHLALLRQAAPWPVQWQMSLLGQRSSHGASSQRARC